MFLSRTNHEEKNVTGEMNKSKNQPRIILFVDINGTVIANDSAKDKGLDVAILQLLAENYSAPWDSSKPNEIMTYRKYIEKNLPVDPADGKKSKARPEDYKNFINFLIQANHPSRKEIIENYIQLKKTLNARDVFPSFYKLIQHLNDSKINFSIIFRTFGTDAGHIINEIEKNIQIKFNHFHNFTQGNILNKDQAPCTTHELLQSIIPNQHGAWRDDYQHWHVHNETYEYGKPFPIDLNDADTLSIFFDDNARDKQILNIRTVSQTERNQADIQKDLIQCGRIVAVNTLKAILDEDYFINSIKFALTHHNMVHMKNEVTRAKTLAFNF